MYTHTVGSRDTLSARFIEQRVWRLVIAVEDKQRRGGRALFKNTTTRKGLERLLAIEKSRKDSIHVIWSSAMLPMHIRQRSRMGHKKAMNVLHALGKSVLNNNNSLLSTHFSILSKASRSRKHTIGSKQTLGGHEPGPRHARRRGAEEILQTHFLGRWRQESSLQRLHWQVP